MVTRRIQLMGIVVCVCVSGSCGNVYQFWNNRGGLPLNQSPTDRLIQLAKRRWLILLNGWRVVVRVLRRRKRFAFHLWGVGRVGDAGN